MHIRWSRENTLQLLSVTIGLIVAVVLAEIVLGMLQRQKDVSGQMDPGLVRYDSQLGWRLSPGWRGAHQHQDYSVQYNVNALGFRGELPGTGARLVVLGDSYTFGLGVDEGQNFADVMDNACAEDVLNLAVPGYSPEQVVLSLSAAKAFARGGRVLWTLYLGNDLVDLGLPKAVQADYLKPYIAQTASGDVEILNQPVPGAAQDVAQSSMMREVLGSEERSWWQHSRVLSLLVPESVTPRHETLMRGQWTAKLALLDALLRQHDDGVISTVLLLPGPSFYRAPRSLSAAYQRMILPDLVELLTKLGIEAIDGNDAGLDASDYFPLDGHLTPRGHLKVAEFLSGTSVCNRL